MTAPEVSPPSTYREIYTHSCEQFTVPVTDLDSLKIDDSGALGTPYSTVVPRHGAPDGELWGRP